MPYVYNDGGRRNAHITQALGDIVSLCGVESPNGWAVERAFPFDTGTCEECHRIRYARDQRLSDRRRNW